MLASTTFPNDNTYLALRAPPRESTSLLLALSVSSLFGYEQGVLDVRYDPRHTLWETC